MNQKPTLKGEIVQKYLTKFPNTPQLTLAKKIQKENKEVFHNVDSVRSIIKYYRGSFGKKARKSLINKEFVKPLTHNTNPFDIPESDEIETFEFVMPIANNNILFLTDIHLPYHNKEKLNKALQYGKDNNINTIWLNGDIMDCYQGSNHEKDPRKRNLKGELEVCRQFLESLKKHFPNASIYYKEGNHELRWKRFLQRNAPQLLDMEEFRLDVVLGLGELGIHWIPNKAICKFGNLVSIHGNEVLGSGGQNPARNLFFKTRDNIICGDKHKTDTYMKHTISDKSKLVGAWAVACLCELNPDFMGLALEWNHGFAHIRVKQDKSFTVKNIRFNGNDLEYN